MVATVLDRSHDQTQRNRTKRVDYRDQQVLKGHGFSRADG
jgi:hypothetical protein